MVDTYFVGCVRLLCQVQAPLSRHLAQLEGLGSRRCAAFDQTPWL